MILYHVVFLLRLWAATGGIKPRNGSAAGFTLIELSIVLVIIGLIVGGILVGQDLIRAAEVRAQITQIEKFNSAVNTFHGKYNAIPGDMNVATAEQFGFTVGSGCVGQQGGRDGNGLIDGYLSPSWTLVQGAGETALFWQDLTSPALGAFLIEGQFPNSEATATNCSGAAVSPSDTAIGEYFPFGKLRHATFVYVYEIKGINWYGLSAVTGIVNNGALTSNADIPVIEAYNIDKKMDDGLPTAGNVQVNYLNNDTAATYVAPHALSDTSSTCYNTSSGTYSISYSGGAGANCALSFQFQ